MCTLSIYTAKKQCIITMNRDELRSRSEANVLHTESLNGINLVYPVDSVSGGTWMGMNNKGVVLCLLNHYHGQTFAAQDPLSRGLIIPTALAKGDMASIHNYLLELESGSFNPFDLFLNQKQHIRHYIWDGHYTIFEDVTAEPWYMFTSSLLKAEEVITYRHRLFESWCKEMGNELTDPEEILRGFHLIQTKNMETQSVLMEREQSHTKSVVQVELAKDQISLKYYPEILHNPLREPIEEAMQVSD